jgi:serine/threonine protein kinase
MNHITTINKNKNNKDTEYIGKGSYGLVTKNGSIVTKTCKIFCYQDQEEDFYLDDHSIREAIFYQTVTKDRLTAKNSNNTMISKFYDLIPSVNVTIQNNHSLLFEMDYLGQTMNNFKYNNKEKTIILFSYILHTLHSLHLNGFSHGDLKPENILINPKTLKPTIIDYGSICFWHHSSIYPNSYQRCTLYYVSPEELSNVSYSDKNDMWSFGVILFEWITGLSFIRTLLKDCGISEKELEMFYEYTCNIKTDNAFNPTLYLTNFYSSIQYGQIFSCICKHIKDRDFIKVIGHCLLKDTNIRCTASKLLESDIFKSYACLYQNNENEIKNEEICEMNDIERENMHDLIWKWCESNHKFNISIYGHSIMLFDRLLLRINNSKQYIPYTVLALACIVLSSMILKGSLIRASTIAIIHNDIIQNNPEHYSTNEIDIKEVKYYLGLIFSISQFLLFNKSPDMFLLEEKIDIDYNLYREICKKYLLTTSTTDLIIQKYKENKGT